MLKILFIRSPRIIPLFSCDYSLFKKIDSTFPFSGLNKRKVYFHCTETDNPNPGKSVKKSGQERERKKKKELEPRHRPRRSPPQIRHEARENTFRERRVLLVMYRRRGIAGTTLDVFLRFSLTGRDTPARPTRVARIS